MEMSLPVLAVLSSSSTLLSYLKQTCSPCPSPSPCGRMWRGASPVQPPWLHLCLGLHQGKYVKRWSTYSTAKIRGKRMTNWAHLSSQKKYKGRGGCGWEVTPISVTKSSYGPQSSHKIVLVSLTFPTLLSTIHSVITPLRSSFTSCPASRTFHAVSFPHCSSSLP